MPRVAVIGANGQVGAELCLLLTAHPGIELVPICRNRSGSAFLRWQGVACRHGRIANSDDAPRLLGDCDIIVNSSLASGSPAEIRRTEDQIIHNAFACSKDSATIIHFSTQSVYGDPRPNRRIRWRNPYGRAKLATEHRVRTEQGLYRKAAYILRLGHVCGSLQEISHNIRTEIRTHRVVFPARDSSSNTVYTVAIVEAILQIMRDGVQPGTYDLMNSPPWGWRQVYEYEARLCNTELSPRIAPASPPPSRLAALTGAALRLAGSVAAAEPVRNLFAKLFAYVPDQLNSRALAWWYKTRARSEIAALTGGGVEAPEHLSWVANGVHFFPADRPTADALTAMPPDAVRRTGVLSWPADLPDA